MQKFKGIVEMEYSQGPCPVWVVVIALILKINPDAVIAMGHAVGARTRSLPRLIFWRTFRHNARPSDVLLYHCRIMH